MYNWFKTEATACRLGECLSRHSTSACFSRFLLFSPSVHENHHQSVSIHLASSTEKNDAFRNVEVKNSKTRREVVEIRAKGAFRTSRIALSTTKGQQLRPHLLPL
jgi:hypothetical protein